MADQGHRPPPSHDARLPTRCLAAGTRCFPCPRPSLHNVCATLRVIIRACVVRPCLHLLLNFVHVVHQDPWRKQPGLQRFVLTRACPPGFGSSFPPPPAGRSFTTTLSAKGTSRSGFQLAERLDGLLCGLAWAPCRCDRWPCFVWASWTKGAQSSSVGEAYHGLHGCCRLLRPCRGSAE